MKEKFAGVGAVLSAFAASACCTGPLILASLGLGGIGFAAALAPYRGVFLALTAGFLIVAFVLAYRKRDVRCADGSCVRQSASRATKAFLWAVTVLAIALASSERWIGVFW